jgi:hypothetical protein
VRLALYVCLKNICDGVGGQDESNGTPLDPPLFWLDNIFKQKTRIYVQHVQLILFLEYLYFDIHLHDHGNYNS